MHILGRIVSKMNMLFHSYVSHFLQQVITFFSHFFIIVEDIESQQLSTIFFFFIRAGTKVPASFLLWDLFFLLRQYTFTVKGWNKAFSGSLPFLKKTVFNSQIQSSIQYLFIFSCGYFPV